MKKEAALATENSGQQAASTMLTKEHCAGLLDEERSRVTTCCQRESPSASEPWSLKTPEPAQPTRSDGHPYRSSGHRLEFFEVCPSSVL